MVRWKFNAVHFLNSSLFLTFIFVCVGRFRPSVVHLTSLMIGRQSLDYHTMKIDLVFLGSSLFLTFIISILFVYLSSIRDLFNFASLSEPRKLSDNLTMESRSLFPSFIAYYVFYVGRYSSFNQKICKINCIKDLFKSVIISYLVTSEELFAKNDVYDVIFIIDRMMSCLFWRSALW